MLIRHIVANNCVSFAFHAITYAGETLDLLLAGVKGRRSLCHDGTAIIDAQGDIVPKHFIALMQSIGRPRHSAVIRKQLDWVVEATHRIFADTLKIEFAFDEIGKRMGQKHVFSHLLGERL